MFISSNNGTGWTAVNSGLTSLSVNTLTISGSNIFAGTLQGIYLSTNTGSSWSLKGLTTQSVTSTAVSGSNIFAGTESGGVFLSTNNGTNWTAVNNGLVYLHIYSLIVSGTVIFAGTDGGTFMSTDNGTSWLNKNQGFQFVTRVNSLLITNNKIFGGTGSNSVWRRSLSEIQIGIKQISGNIPLSYSLSQNYPNPFNPGTIIRFSIPSLPTMRITGGNTVRLKVFDITGREIQTLIDEPLAPGTYETYFDGSALPTGVYIYRLTANGFTETKKMMYVK